MRTLKRYVQVVYIVLVWACVQTMIVSAQSETPPQVGTIGDFVYASEYGSVVPLANVSVTLWQNDVEIANTRTDTDGRYAFSDLSLGEYDVEVKIVADDIRDSTDQATCYEWMSPSYVLDNGDDSRVTVLLTEQNRNNDGVDFGYDCIGFVFSLGGSVTNVDVDENIPLQDVRVVRLEDETVVAETTTDENGFYLFDTFLVDNAFPEYAISVEVDTSTLPEGKQQVSSTISPDNDGDHRVTVWDDSYYYYNAVVMTEDQLRNLHFAYSNSLLTVTYLNGHSNHSHSTNWVLIVAAGMAVVTSIGFAFCGRTIRK